MTLSFGDYLVGAVELGFIVCALGFAAWRLRAALLPAWEGAPARLVETVVAVVLAIWIAEVLGTFSLYEDVPVLVACAAVAGRAWWLARSPLAPRRSAADSGPPALPGGRVAWICAARRHRGGRRRLDGADAPGARRRHGPRRLALVPHAARDPVRAERRPRRRSTTSTRSSSPRSTRRTPRSCTRSGSSPSAATSSRRCSTSAGSRSACSPRTASAAPGASARSR